jgi:hypothetical protein
VTGRVWRWFGRHPWVTSLVLVGCFAVAAGVRDGLREADDGRQEAAQRAFVECVARWADDTSARARTVTGFREDVDAANDDLWRTMAALLATPRPDGQQEFQRHLDAYVVASDAYRNNLKLNPPPIPPRLGCAR